MSADTQLWIGIAAGAVIGVATTWITTAIGIAIGRHIARSRDGGPGEPDPVTGEVWPTLDTDHKRLIEREGGTR